MAEEPYHLAACEKRALPHAVACDKEPYRMLLLETQRALASSETYYSLPLVPRETYYLLEDLPLVVVCHKGDLQLA